MRDWWLARHDKIEAVLVTIEAGKALRVRGCRGRGRSSGRDRFRRKLELGRGEGLRVEWSVCRCGENRNKEKKILHSFRQNIHRLCSDQEWRSKFDFYEKIKVKENYAWDRNPRCLAASASPRRSLEIHALRLGTVEGLPPGVACLHGRSHCRRSDESKEF